MGKLLTIYTDGACQVSTGNGGVGAVFIKDNEVIYQFNKHFKDVTNNQMEIMAVIYALHAISTDFDSITIVSDSQYVLGCINKGWKRKKNQNYWQLFDRIYSRAKEFCSDIKFEWTKGHNIDEYNNLADRLAVEASHFADQLDYN